MGKEHLYTSIYAEVQRFYENKIMAAACPVLTVIFIISAMRSLTGNPTALDFLTAAAYLATIFLIMFICFYMRLETTVTSFGIEVRFVPFVKRVIPFAEIKRGRIRTYKPIREYGGWGIRGGLNGNGAALNISGNIGLQLDLEGGKKILIGTRHPDALASALIDKIPLVVS